MRTRALCSPGTGTRKPYWGPSDPGSASLSVLATPLLQPKPRLAPQFPMRVGGRGPGVPVGGEASERKITAQSGHRALPAWQPGQGHRNGANRHSRGAAERPLRRALSDPGPWEAVHPPCVRVTVTEGPKPQGPGTPPGGTGPPGASVVEGWLGPSSVQGFRHLLPSEQGWDEEAIADRPCAGPSPGVFLSAALGGGTEGCGRSRPTGDSSGWQGLQPV